MGTREEGESGAFDRSLDRRFSMLGGAFLGILIGCTAMAWAGDAAMRVSTATGLIEVKAALLEEWIAVEEGELLLPGDLLRTRAESTADILCPEGTLLALAPQTTLDVRKIAFESDTRTLTLEVVLWQGQITLTTPRRHPESTLRLRSPELTLEPGAEGARIELIYDRATGTRAAVLEQTATLIFRGSTRQLSAGQRFPFTEPPSPGPEGAERPAGGSLPPEEGHPAEIPPGPEETASVADPEEPLSPPEAPDLSPERSAPAEVPLAIWKRMSPSERADLKARWPEMTEAQRGTLRHLTEDQWQAARNVVRTLICQTHLQQIGVAFLRYAEKNGGVLPEVEGWQEAIYPYLEAGASWDCPEEGQEQTLDYLFNRNLSGVPLSALSYPRLTVLAFEGAPHDDSAGGGEADLELRHEGAGNVLFADGHVRAMKLPLYRNVRWQP